jgi:hypothetical protein
MAVIDLAHATVGTNHPDTTVGAVRVWSLRVVREACGPDWLGFPVPWDQTAIGCALLDRSHDATTVAELMAFTGRQAVARLALSVTSTCRLMPPEMAVRFAWWAVQVWHDMAGTTATPVPAATTAAAVTAARAVRPPGLDWRRQASMTFHSGAPLMPTPAAWPELPALSFAATPAATYLAATSAVT